MLAALLIQPQTRIVVPVPAPAEDIGRRTCRSLRVYLDSRSIFPIEAGSLFWWDEVWFRLLSEIVNPLSEIRRVVHGSAG